MEAPAIALWQWAQTGMDGELIDLGGTDGLEATGVARGGGQR